MIATSVGIGIVGEIGITIMIATASTDFLQEP